MFSSSHCGDSIYHPALKDAPPQFILHSVQNECQILKSHHYFPCFFFPLLSSEEEKSRRKSDWSSAA